MLPLRNVKIQTSTRIHSRDEENRDISIPDEKSCTFINLFRKKSRPVLEIVDQI